MHREYTLVINVIFNYFLILNMPANSRCRYYAIGLRRYNFTTFPTVVFALIRHIYVFTPKPLPVFHDRGESGAGKTENTKKVIMYFAKVAAQLQKTTAEEEKQLAESGTKKVVSCSAQYHLAFYLALNLSVFLTLKHSFCHPRH